MCICTSEDVHVIGVELEDMIGVCVHLANTTALYKVLIYPQIPSVVTTTYSLTYHNSSSKSGEYQSGHVSQSTATVQSHNVHVHRV